MKNLILTTTFLTLTAPLLCRAAMPPLLTSEGGTKITTAAAWEETRRPEVLELFKTHVFGRNAVERPDTLRFSELEPDKVMMEGAALRKRVNIEFSGPGGKGVIALTAFIPRTNKSKMREGKCPAFVLICNRTSQKHIDPERLDPNPFFPAEEIVARGYAALAFYNGDVDPDFHDGFTNGVHAVFQPDPSVRKDDAWGTIAAWAWGASRVMDWIETEPLIDAKRVAVIGHSRGGKTALWAGASDQRFALTISNNSGRGGARLNRMELPKSEGLERINKSFPHWFCTNYKKFGDDSDALPIDQHQLIALMAPRLVYVASATQDAWAGPRGEFESCVLASPAWELYGKKGLVADGFPPPDTPLQTGSIGYHLRTGKHNLGIYDWQCYMDFFDKATP